jgi:hypothetical protein
VFQRSGFPATQSSTSIRRKNVFAGIAGKIVFASRAIQAPRAP